VRIVAVAPAAGQLDLTPAVDLIRSVTPSREPQHKPRRKSAPNHRRKKRKPHA